MGGSAWGRGRDSKVADVGLRSPSHAGGVQVPGDEEDEDQEEEMGVSIADPSRTTAQLVYIMLLKYPLLKHFLKIVTDIALAYVFSSALLPPKTTDKWSAYHVIAAAGVTPIRHALNETINTRYDVRDVLRAETRFDNSMLGLLKLFLKRIIVPGVPIFIMAHTLASADKNIDDPHLNGFVNAMMGVITYLVVAALIERQFRPHKHEYGRKFLGSTARSLRDYIGRPLLTSATSAVLSAEFLRQTPIDTFHPLAKKLYPAIAFVLLFYTYHGVQKFITDYRGEGQESMIRGISDESNHGFARSNTIQRASFNVLTETTFSPVKRMGRETPPPPSSNIGAWMKKLAVLSATVALSYFYNLPEIEDDRLEMLKQYAMIAAIMCVASFSCDVLGYAAEKGFALFKSRRQETKDDVPEAYRGLPGGPRL